MFETAESHCRCLLGRAVGEQHGGRCGAELGVGVKGTGMEREASISLWVIFKLQSQLATKGSEPLGSEIKQK